MARFTARLEPIESGTFAVIPADVAGAKRHQTRERRAAAVIAQLRR